MGILSEVKCGRCDRRYSGLRSKCPYCGTRRGNKRAKRSTDESGSTWKLVIGLLLLLILIVAVVTLVVSSLSEGKGEAEEKKEEVTDPVDVNNIDDGVTEMSNEPEQSSEQESEKSEEEPLVPEPTSIVLESLIMTYSGEEIAYTGYDTDYEISMDKGDTLRLGYEATPADLELQPGDVVWASSDINSVVILQTGEVTVVGDSSATVSVTIGNLTKTCYIRVE